MSGEIIVKIKMIDGVSKVISSEAIIPNNISTLVSQLKKVKEDVNGYLTELINKDGQESVKDEDDFEGIYPNLNILKIIDYSSWFKFGNHFLYVLNKLML